MNQLTTAEREQEYKTRNELLDMFVEDLKKMGIEINEDEGFGIINRNYMYKESKRNRPSPLSDLPPNRAGEFLGRYINLKNGGVLVVEYDMKNKTFGVQYRLITGNKEEMKLLVGLPDAHPFSETDAHGIPIREEISYRPVMSERVLNPHGLVEAIKKNPFVLRKTGLEGKI